MTEQTDRAEIDDTTLLYVSKLTKIAAVPGAKDKKIRLLDEITLQLLDGETLGIIGESGSGKTLLLHTILGLVPATSGAVYFEIPPESMYLAIKLEKELGSMLSPGADPSDISYRQDDAMRLHKVRVAHSMIGKSIRSTSQQRRQILVVFQDPKTAMDPKKTVFESIAESFKREEKLTSDEVDKEVREVAASAGLRESDLVKFPADLNVEEMQIVNIARAISVEPKLVILDEPTSNMDVSAQAQILNTLRDYQYSRGMSYLVASNNLNVVRVLSDRVAVMYLGRVVEFSTMQNIYSGMLHPYTKMLISKSATLENSRELIDKSVDDQSPAFPNIPRGCAFHTRCPVAFKDCGWAPSEIAPLISEILTFNRRGSLNLFPPYSTVEADNTENTIKILFGGAKISFEFVEELNRLIEGRTLLEGGVPLKAIANVEIPPSGDMVIIKTLKPKIPKYLEVRPAHFAACFQYGGLDEEPEETKE